MGFWHTGYLEFHETQWLGELPKPAPAKIPCDKCDSLFDTRDELLRHRFEKHPNIRPLLHIRGAQVRSDTFKIKSQISAADILITGATICIFEGRVVSSDELAILLQEITNQLVTVELKSPDGHSAFSLDFAVANESDILGVEEAFIRMAQSRSLSLLGIESFINDCQSYDSANEYCDGICRYLYGVLAKEQHPDSGIPKNKYVEYFNKAEDQLKGYNRHIAGTIRALVTFHFNQFSLAQTYAPGGHIKRASASFSALLEGMPWSNEIITCPQPDNPIEDLLTDQDTLAILKWSNFESNKLHEHLDNIAKELGRNIVTYDIVKMKLLLAEGHYSAGNLDEARQIARELASNDISNIWAKSLLEKIAA